MTPQQARERFNALSDDPENHTREVRVRMCYSVTEPPAFHEREETPREARTRMEQESDTWEENSYHSGVLRSPENQRWVTAMDIALGQAKSLDDPAMREVLVAIADWRMDEQMFDKVEGLAGWSRLSADTQALVEASSYYYQKGEFPSAELVPLTPPYLLCSASKKGEQQ